MYRIFILILIVISVIEIWGLILVGGMIGAWQTFVLLIVSGLIGAYLARREMKRVWSLAKLQISQRQLPTQSILDGICILAGGLLLLAPGFFTDILGILLVIPPTRGIFRLWLVIWLQKRFVSGNIQIFRRH